jgi:hypothetical protein
MHSPNGKNVLFYSSKCSESHHNSISQAFTKCINLLQSHKSISLGWESACLGHTIILRTPWLLGHYLLGTKVLSLSFSSKAGTGQHWYELWTAYSGGEKWKAQDTNPPSQMVFLIVMKRQNPTPIFGFRIVYFNPKSMPWVNQTQTSAFTFLSQAF